jgi:transposase-like protein
MGDRKRYNDEFRASAVLMLEAAGYPDKEGALTAVSKRLGVAHQTLSRWARAVQNPPPSILVQEKRIDLVGELTELLGLTVRAAKATVDDASYKELATAIGIYIDKLQLLTGNPTERQEVNVTDHRERILAGIARKADRLAAGETDGFYPQPVG